MSWLAIDAAGRREVRVDVGLFGIVFPVVWNRCRGGELHRNRTGPASSYPRKVAKGISTDSTADRKSLRRFSRLTLAITCKARLND
jgi:hypothetical protein